jgi:hypothetical protein
VLIVGELLFRLLLHGSGDPLSAPLLARTAPLTSVRPLYAFFILLPVSLGFLAIGVPFFLRTLSAAARGRIDGRTRQALLAFGVCLLVLIVELNVGGDGLVAMSAVAAVGAWQGRGPVARFGASHGFTLIGVAGVSIAALAWYEARALGEAEPSIAIAPTLLVVSLFLAGAGLVAATANVLEGCTESRVALAVAWLAMAAWLGAPLLRSVLLESAAGADRFELAATAAAAIALTAVGGVQRFRA